MSTQSNLTTDRETIREWADDHDVVPVEYTAAGGTSTRLDIVSERDHDDAWDEISWNEFFEKLDESDQIVAYHGDRSDRPTFEVEPRSDLAGRSSIEADDAEQALMEGETVTTEVTETVVVEETIVEEATIENEVVDRETIQEEIVDAELVAREVTDCTVTDVEGGGDREVDLGQFDTGYRSTGDLGVEVEVEVDESWALTKEILERLTVESRVTETGATETDAVVTDEIDVEGVQRSVLESDLPDSDVTPGEVTESHAVESEFAEGDTIHTTLTERKTVDEEMSLQKRLTGEAAEAETVSADGINRQTRTSALVENEEMETVERETDTTTEATSTESTAATETEAVPTEADEGKTVVGPDGEEIGMLFEAKGDTVYVDPHPSITDRIKAALDWGEIDEDTYPVDADRVTDIDENRVELSVDDPADTDSERRR